MLKTPAMRVLSHLSNPYLARNSSARLLRQRVAIPGSWIVKRGKATYLAARSASTATALRPPSQLEHFMGKPHEKIPIASQNGSQVSVQWDLGTRSQYHNIWLRDHCRCAKCFHPVTKQRDFNTSEIPRDITPVRVESTSTGLEVTWPSKEPHISQYPWTWLQTNSYDPPLNGMSETANPKMLWGSKVQQGPLTVTYEEVMTDDCGLYKWLSNVYTFGLSFVSGVPTTPEATEELSKRIGFIRETQYGNLWELWSDLAEAGDTAYSNVALGAHTDNTYFTDPTGLQIFHLLSHTDGTGGHSLLVDGFYVASLVKKNHPNAYDLLSRVAVPAHSAGQPEALYSPSPASGYPVLGHDPVSGELTAVRWNNDDRSVMNHLAPEFVEKWYDAIRVWNKYLKSAQAEYWVQMQPGTVVAIDNHRVLHGRSAFTGSRRLCGTYIGVDEYKSKLAVLRERFDTDATGNVISKGDGGRSVWNVGL